jgi:hypothetical protein
MFQREILFSFFRIAKTYLFFSLGAEKVLKRLQFIGNWLSQPSRHFANSNKSNWKKSVKLCIISRRKTNECTVQTAFCQGSQKQGCQIFLGTTYIPKWEK